MPSFKFSSPEKLEEEFNDLLKIDHAARIEQLSLIKSVIMATKKSSDLSSDEKFKSLSFEVNYTDAKTKKITNSHLAQSDEKSRLIANFEKFKKLTNNEKYASLDDKQKSALFTKFEIIKSYPQYDETKLYQYLTKNNWDTKKLANLGNNEKFNLLSEHGQLALFSILIVIPPYSLKPRPVTDNEKLMALYDIVKNENSIAVEEYIALPKSGKYAFIYNALSSEAKSVLFSKLNVPSIYDEIKSNKYLYHDGLHPSTLVTLSNDDKFDLLTEASKTLLLSGINQPSNSLTNDDKFNSLSKEEKAKLFADYDENFLLTDEKKSKIITGAMLYIKYKIEDTYKLERLTFLNPLVAKVYSADRSSVHKAIDEKIGVSLKNPLDNTSKIEALSAFINFLAENVKPILIDTNLTSYKLNDPEGKNKKTDINITDDVRRYINLNLNSELTALKSKLKMKSSELKHPESPKFNLSKSGQPIYSGKPLLLHESTIPMHWKDVIHFFNHATLNKVTTVEKQAKLVSKDLQDPTIIMDAETKLNYLKEHMTKDTTKATVKNIDETKPVPAVETPTSAQKEEVKVMTKDVMKAAKQPIHIDEAPPTRRHSRRH